MTKPAFNFRVALVCLMAASVGFPIAIISLSKAALLLFALGALVCLGRRSTPAAHLTAMATPLAIFLALAYLALSITWSSAPLPLASDAWAKYAKLIVIPVLLWSIRSEREARLAMMSFVAAQIFLLFGSWMLWLGLPVPWATSRMALTGHTVFSSYLDQAIMSSVTAAFCWHLRSFAPGRWGGHLALAAMVLAIANVFIVMNGRTGHVVLIALLSLIIMWALPKPYRWLTVAMPFLILLAAMLGSAKVHNRMTAAVGEINSYIKSGEISSSSGERLNYWRRSLESIRQHPVAGSGVGSWNAEFTRLNKEKASIPPTNVRNPHQEYLLWGVEAGMVGMLLLFNILWAVYRDTLRMRAATARATQSVLAALGIACLFNSSLFDATIGDFFCVALGLTLALGRQARTLPHPAPAHEAASA